MNAKSIWPFSAYRPWKGTSEVLRRKPLSEACEYLWRVFGDRLFIVVGRRAARGLGSAGLSEISYLIVKQGYYKRGRLAQAQGMEVTGRALKQSD